MGKTRTASPASADETSAMGTPGSGALGSRLRDAIQRRKRPLLVACGALIALVAWRMIAYGGTGSTLENALGGVLARDGLQLNLDSVVWLEDNEGPLHMRSVLFLAAREGELHDLYYAEVRPGGNTTALDVAWVTNLTETAIADEVNIQTLGPFLSYSTQVDGQFDAIVLVDPRAERAALTESWPLRAQLQNHITNLQETGRWNGMGRRRYQLQERLGQLTPSVRDGHFIYESPNQRFVFDPHHEAPIEGGGFLELATEEKGLPGTVTWLVDTVRNIHFIGPEPIEWLENRVFNFKDWWTRQYYAYLGEEDTAAEVAEDLEIVPEIDEERLQLLTATDPELGWPPAPMAPLLEQPVVEGEGEWRPVVDDPYVNAYANAPPAFYQAFLRTDPERPYTRVYVTLWDPRQVQLRLQAGTREPESASGEHGSGLIPRDPETMERLVGAFNGGFQALHGEFGMRSDGRTYLPPKPWSITVAIRDDGRVAMGSWPAPNWRGRYYDERLANRQIPPDFAEFRQNLTSVVEDGVYNPWERWWWGAAPQSVEEQTYTTRSGLCLTEDGFMGFFWGQGIGPDTLGDAMIAARCSRGMHLDMNNPHCGFEFFRPYRADQEVAALARPPRRDSQFQGIFPRTRRRWRLRARRAVRSMGMPFPRFVNRDGRDFFYLTLRPVLPGPDLPGAPDGEGAFSTQGLPHARWPHAFARTHLTGPDNTQTWFVRIDPRRALPQTQAREGETHVLAELSGVEATAPETQGFGLISYNTPVGPRYAIREAGEGDRLILSGNNLAQTPEARTALAVDSDGFLIYAEAESDAEVLRDRLAHANITQALALPQGARLLFRVAGATAAVDGFSTESQGPTFLFIANERPESEVIFRENAPMPYARWGYLQGQRVRYFREGPFRFARPQQEE